MWVTWPTQGCSWHKSSATHSCQCERQSLTSWQLYGSQCFGSITCAQMLTLSDVDALRCWRSQTLMHVIAHGGHKSLYRKLALREKSLVSVSVTLGIEPASVVFRSFQSDALPTELPLPLWLIPGNGLFGGSLQPSLFFSFFFLFYIYIFFFKYFLHV